MPMHDFPHLKVLLRAIPMASLFITEEKEILGINFFPVTMFFNPSAARHADRYRFIANILNRSSHSILYTALKVAE